MREIRSSTSPEPIAEGDLCHFCKRPAAVRCSKKFRFPIIIYPSEIRVGDGYTDAAGVEHVVQTIREVREPSILPDQHYWLLNERWRVYHEHLHLIVTRKLACASACCEVHHSELDEGVYLCEDHRDFVEEMPLPEVPIQRKEPRKIRGRKVHPIQGHRSEGVKC